MENLEILEECQNKTLSELTELISLLKNLRNKKWDNAYKEIKIHPGERIEDKIFKETGFKCFHEPAHNSLGRGTHVICIPKERYSNELEQELRTKYDDKW